METEIEIEHSALFGQDADELDLLTAAAALYRMNDAPGTHTITIPNDPHGNWTYEFTEATDDDD